MKKAVLKGLMQILWWGGSVERLWTIWSYLLSCLNNTYSPVLSITDNLCRIRRAGCSCDQKTPDDILQAAFAQLVCWHHTMTSVQTFSACTTPQGAPKEMSRFQMQYWQRSHLLRSHVNHGVNTPSALCCIIIQKFTFGQWVLMFSIFCHELMRKKINNKIFILAAVVQ